MASKSNPIYSAFIVNGSQKFDVTPLLQSIDISDREKEWACRATIDLMDYKDNGLPDIVKYTSRVFIYADTGGGRQEVFRGFAWTGSSGHSLNDKTVRVMAYDNLIFMQESEDHIFYVEGKSTKAIISDICSRWGVNLSYSYQSITHSKLALRGNLSDIMTKDILDLVKDRTNQKYVVLSKKDTMYVAGLGQNASTYTFTVGNNAISTRKEWTKDGMVTKVVILGKEEEDVRAPVESTISGDTASYGTLQKVITRDSNTTLADAKTEANNIIKKNGQPAVEYELKAIDVPWIRKGDRVNIKANNFSSTQFIVKSVNRSITNKSKDITLTLETA